MKNNWYKYIKSFFTKEPVYKGLGVTSDSNITDKDLNKVKEIFYLKVDSSLGVFEIVRVFKNNRKQIFYEIKHKSSGVKFTLSQKVIEFFFINENLNKDYQIEEKQK